MITVDSFAGTVPGFKWCAVCGAEAMTWSRQHPLINRCRRHQRSHACCIEGCSRSRAAGPNERTYTWTWMCAAHWRALVPPRSRERRLYLAHFRRVKRIGGWTDELRTKFWEFWARLVARANKRAAGEHEGSIDIAEIERMFG